MLPLKVLGKHDKAKIISIGNSAGVLLPKEVLTTLGLSPGDTLYASETENGIALTAYDSRKAALPASSANSLGTGIFC